MEIVRYDNQLAGSNCFMITDWDSKSCIIIDPASEKAEREIAYIGKNGLTLDYIILTHGHADHCWGVNALRKAHPGLKLVYSEACKLTMKREIRLFFQLYSPIHDYQYEMEPAEIQIKENNETLNWHLHLVELILTPGHSPGSMCIYVEGNLFTGDTMMPFPPYFNGRGSSVDDWDRSVKTITERFSPDTKIYPGHGAVITLEEWKNNKEYSNHK